MSVLEASLAYPGSVELLHAHAPRGAGVEDWGAVEYLLRAYLVISNGLRVGPTLGTFPPPASLESCVRSIFSRFRDLLLDEPAMLGRAVPLLDIVFRLYAERARLERQAGVDPLGSKSVVDVARYLEPVDDLVLAVFERLSSAVASERASLVGALVLAVLKSLVELQWYMGIEFDAFFTGLQREAAGVYLRFFYVAADGQGQLEEDYRLVHAAELMAPPEVGRAAYMDYAHKLASVPNVDPSLLQRYFLRRSALLNVWSVPAVSCAACDQYGTLQCSRCKRQFYCGTACQARHWSAKHKTLCALFGKVDS